MSSLTSRRQLAAEKFKKFCESRELKDFSDIVQVIHQDGSIFVLHHASLWKSEETIKNDMGIDFPAFIGVSTEHNGDMMFFGADLYDLWVR